MYREVIQLYIHKCIYIYTYIFFFYILFHYRLLQGIQYSSLCYTVGPCWLSILHTSSAILYLKTKLEITKKVIARGQLQAHKEKYSRMFITIFFRRVKTENNPNGGLN